MAKELIWGQHYFFLDVDKNAHILVNDSRLEKNNMINRPGKQRGFSLIEILLVIGILMGLVALEIRKNIEENDNTVSDAIGTQLVQLGEAVDKYIILRQSELKEGTVPATEATAVAPDIWEINMGALRANTLYPNAGLAGEGVNSPLETPFGAKYRILIKRVFPPPPSDMSICAVPSGLLPLGCPDVEAGSANPPNYQAVLQGLIITDIAWREGSEATGAIKWNALSRAVRNVGGSTGVSQNGNLVGLQGSFAVPAADYAGVISDGQIGMIVGVSSSVLSKFVRRDGSLPMVGNLNMGNQEMHDMKDLFLNGAITHRRNKNLTSLVPNMVFLGAYIVGNGDSISKPTCPTRMTRTGNTSVDGTPKIKLLLQMVNPDFEVTGENSATVPLNPVNSQVCADAQKYKSEPSEVDPAVASCNPAVTTPSEDSKAKSAWWIFAEDVTVTDPSAPSAPVPAWKVYFERRFSTGIDPTTGVSLTRRVGGGGIAEIYCQYDDQQLLP